MKNVQIAEPTGQADVTKATKRWQAAGTKINEEKTKQAWGATARNLARTAASQRTVKNMMRKESYSSVELQEESGAAGTSTAGDKEFTSEM